MENMIVSLRRMENKKQNPKYIQALETEKKKERGYGTKLS